MKRYKESFKMDEDKSIELKDFIKDLFIKNKNNIIEQKTFIGAKELLINKLKIQFEILSRKKDKQMATLKSNPDMLGYIYITNNKLFVENNKKGFWNFDIKKIVNFKLDSLNVISFEGKNPNENIEIHFKIVNW